MAHGIELAPALLRDSLADGEVLLWAGKPAPGLRLTLRDVVLVPLSLFWGGTALVWEYLAIVARAPLAFCLFGIPFVLVGQYLIWGRFVVDARRRARTAYGLTVHRAILVREGRQRLVASILLDATARVELREGPGGNGTIRFEGATSDARLPTAPFAFELLPEASAIYQMILEIQQA